MYKSASKLAVAALFACVFTSAALAETGSNRVFSAVIKGKNLQSKIKGSKPLQFSIKTPDGSYSFTLQARAPFKPRTTINSNQFSATSSAPALYQGQVSFRDQQSPAAADLIGNILRVRFKSFTSSRFYLAKVQRNTLEGRLIHVPGTVNALCGTHSEAGYKADEETENSTRASASLRNIGEIRQLSIRTDADYEYYDHYGQDINQANSEIQAILNAAEAFYTAQIGIYFDLLGQNVYTDENTQPVTSTDAETLIISYKDEILTNNLIGTSNAFHLFTGKDLNGGTIGIAYRPGICQPKLLDPNPGYPVGVTQRVNTNIQAIVLAHEIGHNLGAEHDAQLSDWIMTPSVSSDNTEFSLNSRQQIANYVNDEGDCIGGTDPLPVPTSMPTPRPTAVPTPLPTATPIATPEPTPVIETGKPVSLTLSALVHSRRSYKFSSLVNANNESSSCIISLQGSSRKRHIDNPISTFNTTLASSTGISTLQSFQAKFKMARKNRKRRRVFFKAVAACGDKVYESNTVVTRVRLPNKRAVVRKFLEKLRLSLQ